MLATWVGLLFDGLAYGSLLFLMSVGLSVSLGLLNVVNLAHGVFALLGGYLFIGLLQGVGLPFIPALVLVFVAIAALGWLSEYLFFSRIYSLPPLEQVLLTLGICFMAMAGASYFWGPSQRFVALPAWLSGQWQWGALQLGWFRLALIGLVVALGAVMWLGLERTLFGARIRAAVDNYEVAQGLGIAVGPVFRWCFALGAGLGGLGGALGGVVLGLEPSFVLKYLVFFFMVVVLGGTGTIRGPLLAAWLLGVLDVLGKYFFPQFAAFVLYALVLGLMLCFPQGLLAKRFD